MEGRIAVVTGSGQGIGKAIALAFAEQGAKIVTNNRKPGMSAASMVTDDQVDKLTAEKKEWYKKGFEAESGDAAATARISGSTFTLSGNLVGMFANPVFEKCWEKMKTSRAASRNYSKRSKAR